MLFQVARASDVDPARAAADIARSDDPTSDTTLGRLCRLLAAHDVLATTIPALPGEDERRRALFALREAVPEAVNRRVAEAQRTIDPTLAKSGGDVIVPVEAVAELVARSRATLAALELDHAIWGHLSDGNLHPNVLPTAPRTARRRRRHSSRSATPRSRSAGARSPSTASDAIRSSKSSCVASTARPG